MNALTPALGKSNTFQQPWHSTFQTPTTKHPKPSAMTPFQRAWRAYKRLQDDWIKARQEEEDAHIAVQQHYPPFPMWLTYYAQPDRTLYRYDLETVRERIKELRDQARQSGVFVGDRLPFWKKIMGGLVAYKAATDAIDKERGIYALRAAEAAKRKILKRAEGRMLITPPQTLGDVLIMLEWLGERQGYGDYDEKTGTHTLPQPSPRQDFDMKVLLTLIHHLRRATAPAAHH